MSVLKPVDDKRLAMYANWGFFKELKVCLFWQNIFERQQEVVASRKHLEKLPISNNMYKVKIK